MARDGRPELLAPAGDWECARAAVANGADAVYFGTDHLNARMRAHNFTCEDVYGLMEFLHSRGVRGYVTMNVLIFPREMPKAVEYLHLLDDAGVDGVIVQDMGLAGCECMPQSVEAFALDMELLKNKPERALICANLSPMFAFCRDDEPLARLLFESFQLP